MPEGGRGALIIDAGTGTRTCAGGESKLKCGFWVAQQASVNIISRMRVSLCGGGELECDSVVSRQMSTSSMYCFEFKSGYS